MTGEIRGQEKRKRRRENKGGEMPGKKEQGRRG
jgi:hypothetical protein